MFIEPLPVENKKAGAFDSPNFILARISDIAFQS